MGTLENRQIAERHWEFMYSKNWSELVAQFAEDGEYMDVGAVPPAVGRQAIADRLELGLGPTVRIVHVPGAVLAEGDLVVTEHKEEWHFHTGEVILHPFTSVMQFRDGRIIRWHDYSHLNNLLDRAPQWWIAHIMSGGAAGIPPG